MQPQLQEVKQKSCLLTHGIQGSAEQLNHPPMTREDAAGRRHFWKQEPLGWLNACPPFLLFLCACWHHSFSLAIAFFQTVEISVTDSS